MSSSFFMDIFRQIGFIKILEALDSASLTPHRQISKTAVRQTSGSTSNESKSFDEIIKEASHRYGIDEGIIGAVIKQESSFNPQAKSSCGAMGLMQLMPGTAESLGVQDAYNPEQNIMAGTKYLKQKLDEFNGNLPLALAAYNAGSGAVRKHGGIPPYKETRAYVNKIMKSIDQMA